MLALREFIGSLKECVTNELEISAQELEESLSERAVDARIMVVGMLIREGWSEREICHALGWSQQRVNWLKNHFNDRMKRRGFKVTWDGIMEFLS